MSAELIFIVGAIAAFVIVLGAIFVYFMSRSRIRQQREESARLRTELEDRLRVVNEQRVSMETELQILRGQLTAAQDKLGDAEKRVEQAIESRHRSEQQSGVLQTQLREREEHFRQQIEQFQEQKAQLKSEFENLANRIFEERGKSFNDASKSALDQMLKPFREQIEGFQKRVNEVHTESVQGHSALQQQIKSVLEVGMKMSAEATSLASALKSDKKTQGTWSEIQAELLLEMSGMKEGREYRREASIKNDDGNEQRPDFIVNLPNDKHIILDSKISLVAYVNANSATEAEERDKWMAEHVAALRNHVKSLSDKNYPKLRGLNSPEFVFMFIGNEAAYLAAVNADPSLAQDAYHRGVAIVTPNTLLASLRIVSHLWSIDKQNSSTRQLADHASKVYEKLRVFIGKMERLGNQLQTAQKTYDESLGTLKTGRGSLLGQVGKFVDMGVAVKEKLPIADGDTMLEEDDPDTREE